MYKRWRTPVQLSHLTLSMFCKESSPRASQPVLTSRVKATESRYLVVIMEEIFRGLARPANMVDGHITAVLASIRTYYEAISFKGPVLPGPTQRRLEAALWSMNRHYAALQAWALRSGLRRWRIVVKAHFALHLALQSRYANPRVAWTYADEDFMSLLKSVGEACAAGAPSHRLVPKVCQKYMAGRDIRLAHT